MKAPLDRHEIDDKNFFQKVLTEVHHNTEKYGQKRLQKRQTAAAYLGRKMRMIPESPSLAVGRKVVKERAIRRDWALSDPRSAIRPVSAFHEQSVPVLNGLRQHT